MWLCNERFLTRLSFCFQDITAGRLQGQTVECQSNHGDINVKAIYADKSWFHSKRGNVSLGTCHGNTSVTTESGNLDIGENCAAFLSLFKVPWEGSTFTF